MPAPTTDPAADSRSDLPEVARRIEDRFGDTVAVRGLSGDLAAIAIEREHLPPALDFLCREASPRTERLVDTVGLDLDGLELSGLDAVRVTRIDAATILKFAATSTARRSRRGNRTSSSPQAVPCPTWPSSRSSCQRATSIGIGGGSSAS